MYTGNKTLGLYWCISSVSYGYNIFHWL